MPQAGRRYVYWSRVGGGVSLTHIEVRTPADRKDRTACGIDYLSGRAIHVLPSEIGIDRPRLCRNCKRAVVDWGE